MTMKNPRILILLLALVLPCSASGEQPSDHKQAIKIGVIASLSGQAQKNGRNWLDGLEFAADKLAADGLEINIIVEDDETKPGKVISAFTKLATVDQVDGIVGGTWDFLAETAFPLAERYKIPFITPTNPIEILSKEFKSNPYVFSNGMSLAAESLIVRKFLLDKQIKSIGLAYINVPYGLAHAELVRKLAKEMKIEILTDDSVTYEGFNDTIKLSALRMAEKKPDLAFLVINYEGVDLFKREIAKLKFDPVVLMTQTLAEAFNLTDKPALYHKSYGIYPDEPSAELTKEFVKKFGHKPRDFAVSGYDALMFLATALNSGKEVLKTGGPVQHQGETGLHSLPSASGSLAETQAAIMSVKDGQLVKYLP